MAALKVSKTERSTRDLTLGYKCLNLQIIISIPRKRIKKQIINVLNSDCESQGLMN